MKTISTRNTTLALLGMLALTVYILACTSFSPDDKQVLYPAFDESGVIGIAVYDRQMRKSDLLFTPAVYSSGGTNAGLALTRAQWLADGKRVLVAIGGGDNQPEHQLQLAVVPIGGRGPFKIFTLGDIKEPGALLVQPLPVAGEQVFVQAADDQVVRLNLKTGTLAGHQFAGLEGKLALYPSPTGDSVFYLLSPNGTNESHVFGRLDPERFLLTPLATFTNRLQDSTLFAFDQLGSRIALVSEGASNTLDLVVLKNGSPEVRRPLGTTAQKLVFGNAVLSARGDYLWASFRRRSADTGGSDFGLMEVPLRPSGVVRETVLLKGVPTGEEHEALYFQLGISHDEKTAAVTSTFLVVAGKPEEFKPEQCALFLVDLSDPQRSITTVPIPIPRRPAETGK